MPSHQKKEYRTAIVDSERLHDPTWRLRRTIKRAANMRQATIKKMTAITPSAATGARVLKGFRDAKGKVGGKETLNVLFRTQASPSQRQTHLQSTPVNRPTFLPPPPFLLGSDQHSSNAAAARLPQRHAATRPYKRTRDRYHRRTTAPQKAIDTRCHLDTVR